MARVALVCEPPDGGVAVHVAQLARGLPAHGHEPVVFGPPALGGRALPFVRDYVHPHRDARALGALVRALRAGRFALVHAHSAKAGAVARVAARVTGLPSVYTPHCFGFVGEVSAARRRFALTVERALAPGTAAIVCVCEDEREVARAAGIAPRGELAVIHNGCPPCAAREAAAGEAAAGRGGGATRGGGGAATGGGGAGGATAVDPMLAALRERGPVAGAVTVLRRQKRVDVLLDAAPRVLSAVPDAAIAIVGDGPDAPRLREHAAAAGLAGDPRVVFLPFTPPAARHLRALDVYALPSAYEAFPIGLLEAQACGVPQVASDVGGVREAVTPETGVLVPPRDRRALADALIVLLRDPARREAMAAASRARHAERFTVERMVAETAALYDTVLG